MGRINKVHSTTRSTIPAKSPGYPPKEQAASERISASGFRWAARGRAFSVQGHFRSPTKSQGYPSLHQVSSVTPLLRWRTSASSCGKSTHRLAASGGSADGHWLCRPSTRDMGVTGPAYPGPILEVCPFRNTPRINPFHSDENCRKGRVT